MGTNSTWTAREDSGMSELITVDVVAESVSTPLQPDSYDYDRLPAELRDQAMLAQGTVLTKLSGAVERVIDAGNTLCWAKEALPHGEYLPWVQQACGLKPKYAAQLTQAAEWMLNVQHAGHLENITDVTTLFLLSADATPEDVRQWAVDRCAAGDPPSRKEVIERKRQSQGKPDRTLAQEVKAALKISSEARCLAASAEHITTRQLMDELDLDDLPKGSQHQNQSHMFLKNGTGWWKVPSPETEAEPTPEPVQQTSGQKLLAIKEAAELLGVSATGISARLSPSALKGKEFTLIRGRVLRPSSERGKCILDD